MLYRIRQPDSLSLSPPDHPPSRLHVPVHPLLWGADHGAVEVCPAPKTHPHVFPTACWCRVLQGWEGAADTHPHTVTFTNPHIFVFQILLQNSVTEYSCLCSGFSCCSVLPTVYCCCSLANISIPGIGVSVPEFRPFFYINVADIAALATEMSYVACECLPGAFESTVNTLNKNINATCKVLVSWAEIKYPIHFPYAQKAYFSQIVCTNMFTSLLLSSSPLPR